VTQHCQRLTQLRTGTLSRRAHSGKKSRPKITRPGTAKVRDAWRTRFDDWAVSGERLKRRSWRKPTAKMLNEKNKKGRERKPWRTIHTTYKKPKTLTSGGEPATATRRGSGHAAKRGTRKPVRKLPKQGVAWDSLPAEVPGKKPNGNPRKTGSIHL